MLLNPQGIIDYQLLPLPLPTYTSKDICDLYLFLTIQVDSELAPKSQEVPHTTIIVERRSIVAFDRELSSVSSVTTSIFSKNGLIKLPSKRRNWHNGVQKRKFLSRDL